ncbi:MAG: response regulator transcription factor [Pseudomonadota bacterium]
MTRASSGVAPHVFVVEDEPSIRQGLCDVLTFRGYRVSASSNGREALETALREGFDLVVLDVMLPELDGFALCSALRKAGRDVPILMLTAKGAEEDVLRGFESGADDYVTKPFSVRELVARVHAMLKRARKLDSASFRIGPFEVHPDRGSARSDAGEIELSAREIQILRLLAEEPGRIVSRRTLLREVWNMNNVEHVETRTVDMHIAKLRKKLGADGARYLSTVRGQGYRWADSRR